MLALSCRSSSGSWDTNRGGTVRARSTGGCRGIPVLVVMLAAASSAFTAEPLAPAAPPVVPPPVKLTAQEDHQKMMDLLGIKTLRRGADGTNRQAANYQNTDEAKANPYPKLPEALVTKDGQKVTTPQQWWEKRRPEIVEDFDREVYGRVPADVPAVKWEVKETREEKVGDVP